MATTTTRLNVRQIVIAGIMGAIAIVLAQTGLGFFPSPTGVSATILHVPAIIAGIIGGWPAGLLAGGIFGLYSFLLAPATGADAIFKDPTVSILPRLFIGVTPYFAYMALRRGNEIFAVAVAAVIGTLTNTILVLGMIVLRGYAPLLFVLPIGAVNGLLEIVAAVIVTVAVVTAWQRVEGGAGGTARRV